MSLIESSVKSARPAQTAGSAGRTRPARHATARGWALGGALLGALAATVLFAPARWLAAAVNQATAGQVLLRDARGTVWDGSGQLVLTGGADSIGSMALPGRVAWQLQPGLAGGVPHVTAQVNAACCMDQALQAQVLPRWGAAKVVVADHASHWPSGLLVGLGTPWNTVQAQGLLALSTQGLSLEWAQGRLAVNGRLQVDAQDITSRLSTLKPVGSYRLVISGGALTTLQLDTLKGSLQLSGSGQWVGERLRFDGVASSMPERLDALSNLLNIIGRRDGARAVIKVG